MRDGGAPAPPDPALVDRFHAALTRLRPDPPVGCEADRIGIAVSGGPDSLALLLLAHAARPGLVKAATVNHGLRAEAADEAAMVASVCADLGISHATLHGPWIDEAGHGPQAAARAHRYSLLEAWCEERGLPWLLTAHHADDQAETLLMRLSRGAGLGGLGAIRAARPLGMPSPGARAPVLLLRPLLGFSKAELIALVAAAGLAAADDPSNRSDRYDRTRARRLLAGTPWLEARRIAASAGHLAEAEAALAWAARREYARRVEADGGEAWMLDPADLPDELLRRVVLLLWSAIEDRAAPRQGRPAPPGPKLTRFVAALRAGETAMLGSVLARPGARWRFTAAPPRRTP